MASANAKPSAPTIAENQIDPAEPFTRPGYRIALPAAQRSGTILDVDRDTYLAFDRASREKHELWDGEVRTKRGVNLTHARIITNLIYALHDGLAPDCIALASKMRIRLPGDRYVYPDVSIVCGPPEVEGESDVLLNPCTIIEVLTPATTAFQLGRKFAGYRASLSIREVLFVYPSAHRVELYTRRAGGLWDLRDHDYEDAVPLATLSHPLSLSRIFPSAPSAA